jgi:hypothetical protein
MFNVFIDDRSVALPKAVFCYVSLPWGGGLATRDTAFIAAS